MSPRLPRRLHRPAAALILIAGLAAYANCYSGMFVFDDLASIVDNPTIRHLGNLALILTPLRMGALTVDGRPLLNLSFAVNYAISGTEVWSYHLFNVLIHVGAALALFGIVRRTLGKGAAGRETPAHMPVLIAFSAALLWVVHPLNTESVTFIVQRAESLMGLLYLLTVYCFVRAAECGGPAGGMRARGWTVLSVAFCLMGMAVKEIIVSAPLAVLLLDRLAFAGSFAEAWRRRKGAYLSLAATWLLLLALIWHTGSRGGTSGFGSGVSAWRYWATQPLAIARYLKQAFWPHPLVFDRGTEWAAGPGRIAGPALLLAGLAAATVHGLVRNRAWGLLGFVFFAVLAPTSIIPNNRQTAVEHRMYLALIPVILAVLGGAALAAGRRREARSPDGPAGTAAGIGLALAALVLAVPAALATRARNSDYASTLSLYGTSAAEMPGNPYAQCNYATALALARRYDEAKTHYEAALRADPLLADAEGNLGNVCAALRRYDEAEAHYRRAMRLKAFSAGPHANLAETYLKEGRVADARREVEIALRLAPGDPGPHGVLGAVLLAEGRIPEALSELGRTSALEPEDAQVHINLGKALRAAGRGRDAIREFQEALRLDPSLDAAEQMLRTLKPGDGPGKAAPAPAG